MDGSIIILDFSTGADGPVLLGNLAVAGPQPGKAVINVTGRLQELRSGADYLGSSRRQRDAQDFVPACGLAGAAPARRQG